MPPVFEWDENKRTANIAKHKVDFAWALYIWDQPTFDRPDRRQDYGEERLVTYGVVADLVLAVVWTPRGDAIRLISARKANEDERKAYHAAVAGPEPDIA